MRFAAGVSAIVVQLAVLAVFVGLVAPKPRLHDPVTWYWNDAESHLRAAQVAERVPRGGRFFNYLGTWDNVYVLTGTAPPMSVWVNPSFWYVLNEYHVGRTMLQQLRSAPGTLVFYRKPASDERRVAQSRFHLGLLSITRPVATVDDLVSWREVVGTPRNQRSDGPAR